MAICADKNWRSGFLGVFSIIGVLAHVIFCSENHALAQITPDGTLGANSSKVTPNVNRPIQNIIKAQKNGRK